MEAISVRQLADRKPLADDLLLADLVNYLLDHVRAEPVEGRQLGLERLVAHRCQQIALLHAWLGLELGLIGTLTLAVAVAVALALALALTLALLGLGRYRSGPR